MISQSFARSFRVVNKMSKKFRFDIAFLCVTNAEMSLGGGEKRRMTVQTKLVSVWKVTS